MNTLNCSGKSLLHVSKLLGKKDIILCENRIQKDLLNHYHYNFDSSSAFMDIAKIVEEESYNESDIKNSLTISKNIDYLSSDEIIKLDNINVLIPLFSEMKSVEKVRYPVSKGSFVSIVINDKKVLMNKFKIFGKSIMYNELLKFDKILFDKIYIIKKNNTLKDKYEEINKMCKTVVICDFCE